MVHNSKHIKLKMCPRLYLTGHQSIKARPGQPQQTRGAGFLSCFAANILTLEYFRSHLLNGNGHFSHLPIGKMASVTAPNMKGIYFGEEREAINR